MLELLISSFFLLTGFTFPFSFWQQPAGTVCNPQGGANLLLHFDGANGGTTFTDNGTVGPNSPHSCTTSSTDTTSTAQVKFGSASLNTGASGNLNCGTSTAWTFGTGDFTIDFWFYATSTSTASFQAVSTQGGSNFDVTLHNGPGPGQRQWIYTVGASIVSLSCGIVGSGGASFNAWHWLVVTRASGVDYCWLDGVSKGSTADTTNFTNTGNIGIGNDNLGSPTNAFDYLDEFRLIKGTALFSGVGNITVPSSAYCN